MSDDELAENELVEVVIALRAEVEKRERLRGGLLYLAEMKPDWFGRWVDVKRVRAQARSLLYEMSVTHQVPVDFNGPRQDGMLPALLEDAPNLAAGDAVILIDDEGGTYPASVCSVDRERALIWVRPGREGKQSR